VPTLADIGEFEAIRRLDDARRSAADVRVGPGDDAAVLAAPEGRDLVITTDAFVEGRHYLPAWCGAEEAGRRLAVANLSDLAAMGARPRWAFHAVGVSPRADVDDLVAFERGLAETLAAHGGSVAGGNLSAVGGPAWHVVTLVGDVRPGRAWTRSGASAADWIAVTGSPGRAGAGFLLAQTLGDAAREPRWKPLLDAWIRPETRLPLALALADTEGVSAAIDVSDGFAGDLMHLCAACALSAVLDEAAWPKDESLADASRALGRSLDALRFGPSDDYELLLAVRPDARERVEALAKRVGSPLTFVGRLASGPAALRLRRCDGSLEPLHASGFDHFR
jgi:thiamine-monophosphate kinase